MFSRIGSSNNSFQIVEAININDITRNLQSRGYTVFKPISRDLQSGLSTSSFTVDKQNMKLSIFVMRLGLNSYICAGYFEGKLVIEKEFKYQSELAGIVQHIFINIKKNSSEEMRFDVILSNLRTTASKIQNQSKDFLNFQQQVKVSPEYQQVKRFQKKFLDKIIKDSDRAIQCRDTIKIKNQDLVSRLLVIEQKKQSLESAFITFQDERQYLTNTAARFDQFIGNIRKQTKQLKLNNLTSSNFNDYLQKLINIKKLELRQKYISH